MTTKDPQADPPNARRVAWLALQRIETSGAYANIVLPAMLATSGLEERDRRFATQLTYGATRMRRALDHLIEPFLLREVDPPIRTLLRLGAYQIHYLQTPAHAAVSETVGITPKKARGFVNAILRRVAGHNPTFPSDMVRLSYPDWIGDLLTTEWGREDAIATLERMNETPPVTERDDGYIQDQASQWVIDQVEADAGQRVLDVCAAPGGKATGIAATGAQVVAADRKRSRARLVVANAERTETSVTTLVADAAHPAVRPRSFDRVLVDAPCSGLGVLRRRADARWNVEPEAPERLAELQRTLVDASAELVAPGGLLIYSVCTLARVETLGIAEHPLDGFTPEPLRRGDGPDEASPWRPFGHGGAIMPHDHDTDGMAVFRWRFSG